MSGLAIAALEPVVEAFCCPTLLVDEGRVVRKVNCRALEVLRMARDELEGESLETVLKGRELLVEREKREGGFQVTLKEEQVERWAEATFHDMSQFLFRMSLEIEELHRGYTAECAEDLEANLHFALGVSGAVADMHRIRKGEIELDTAHVPDLEGELDRLLATFARHAASQGIILKFKKEFGDVTEVFADLPKIERILSNLVTNAIRYTPEKGKICVTLRAVMGSRVRLEGRVQDTGPGIPEGQLTRIFQEGVRLDNSGLGVGLATTQAFVKLMDGEIHARNRKSGGAEFRFSVTVENALGSPNRERKHRIEWDKHRGLRCLIVDDNPMNRKLLERRLEEFGYVMEQASGGAEMLERLQGSMFDFVICDKWMPGMSGDEAVRKWRLTEKAGERLPIFILTGSNSEQERRECLSAGVDKLFYKTQAGQLKKLIPQAVQKFVIEGKIPPLVL